MRYTMLLWPHANARYQIEAVRLATAELEMMLAQLAPDAETAGDEGLGMPCVDIRAKEPLGDAALSALRRHSLLYGLFEARDGLLLPLAGAARKKEPFAHLLWVPLLTLVLTDPV